MTNYLIFVIVLNYLFMPTNAIKNIDTTHFEFVAMEYLGLKNHIYKVVVTDLHIVGLEVNGYITVNNNYNIGTSIDKPNLENPEAYIDKTMDVKYDNIDFDNTDIINMNTRNFRIVKSQIKSVEL